MTVMGRQAPFSFAMLGSVHPLSVAVLVNLAYIIDLERNVAI